MHLRLVSFARGDAQIVSGINETRRSHKPMHTAQSHSWLHAHNNINYTSKGPATSHKSHMRLYKSL